MNNLSSLTAGQQKTKDFIFAYQEKYSIRPTDLEISQHLCRTLASAHFKVDGLLRRKIIKLNSKNLYEIIIQ